MVAVVENLNLVDANCLTTRKLSFCINSDLSYVIYSETLLIESAANGLALLGICTLIEHKFLDQLRRPIMFRRSFA